MLTLNHPGPWHMYVKRPDNIGLLVMEVRNKYLQEQLNYENQLSETLHMQNMVKFQPKGAKDITLNEYVVQDYVEDYLT